MFDFLKSIGTKQLEQRVTKAELDLDYYKRLSDAQRDYIETSKEVAKLAELVIKEKNSAIHSLVQTVQVHQEIIAAKDQMIEALLLQVRGNQ